MDVSAMLVATTIRRVAPSPGRSARSCSSALRPPWSGMTSICGALILVRSSETAARISAAPGRKHRTSPSAVRSQLIRRSRRATWSVRTRSRAGRSCRRCDGPDIRREIAKQTRRRASPTSPRGAGPIGRATPVLRERWPGRRAGCVRGIRRERWCGIQRGADRLQSRRQDAFGDDQEPGVAEKSVVRT